MLDGKKDLIVKRKPLHRIVSALIGICLGSAIAIIGLKDVASEVDFLPLLWNYLMMLVLAFAAFSLQVIIHEGGHLVFGLLSGYRFVTFRIGSLMLRKNKEGYSIKKLSLAGTGGQCLMAPPEGKGMDFPVFFYNMGGVFANLLTAVPFWLLYSSSGLTGLPGKLCAYLALAGMANALLNGIPISSDLVANDASNMRMLQKDRAAKKAYWLELKVNEASVNGIRLKDMPDEWFHLPEGADSHNALVATLLVFEENRLMDALRLEEAGEKIDFLLSEACTLNGIHRNLVILDRMFLTLLQEKRAADLSLLEQKEIKQFLSAMKNFPPVIRTQYALALAEGDTASAQAAMERFEKMAKTYPNPNDLVSERELMDLCDRVFAE